MKIVWRNPSRVISKRVSIIKTGRLEAAGQVQLFYRSSAGPGILGTEFELRVNCSKLHAA
jgi:hypothetical protein